MLQSKTESIKTLKKIKYIKEKNTKEDNNENNNKAIEIKNKKIIIKNILPFLDVKNKIDLIHLNKELNIRKYIYKNLLNLKRLSSEKRIKIWKIILHCEKMQINNYQEITKEIKESEDFKVIMDDTKRTFLLNKDKEKTQNIVKYFILFYIKK